MALAAAAAAALFLAVAVVATRAGAQELTAEAAYPLPGASDVDGDAAVVATFDGSVDHPESIGVRVRDGGGQDIPGAIVFGKDPASVVFRALTPYPAGTYDVEVGVRGDGIAVDDVMVSWSFTVPERSALWHGPGGPILLVLSPADPFDQVYAEILRAEGLTSFTSVLGTELTPQLLDQHRVVLLADPALSGSAGVDLLAPWVASGGDLVAFEPTAALAELAGVTPSEVTIEEGYLSVDTARAPGRGITAESMQFHGSARVAAAADNVQTVATVRGDAGGEAQAPAVTLREVGNQGGSVAAVMYDLAHSVALTRQGNPAWAGIESDGVNPLRPNELFAGETSYLDHDKVAIPQADEQMRLLSNLIGHMSIEGGPLPKLWYFPGDAKAVLVMAADDHGSSDGTRESFDRMLELSPAGCDVDKWECARATSWLYPWSGLSDEDAEKYADLGFDLGVHATTHCNNWTTSTLQTAFRTDLLSFWDEYPSLSPQRGSRLHCIAWSDYVSQPLIGRAWGIRFDMNYSYWPPVWADGQAGFMTGSGLPMRFVDPASGLIDVYQQETHFFDETFKTDLDAVGDAIERAIGPEGFYGAFGTHYDFHFPFDETLMDLATVNNVPMVSAQQMLDWVDARSASTTAGLAWDGSILTFDAQVDPDAEGLLRLMLPVTSNGGDLAWLRASDGPVEYEVHTIKGVDYAFFDAVPGAYTAGYGDAAHGRETGHP